MQARMISDLDLSSSMVSRPSQARKSSSNLKVTLDSLILATSCPNGKEVRPEVGQRDAEGRVVLERGFAFYWP